MSPALCDTFRIKRDEKYLRDFEEVAIDHARSRHPVLRNWRAAWSDLSSWEHSPFCAVRSEETLDV